MFFHSKIAICVHYTQYSKIELFLSINRLLTNYLISIIKILSSDRPVKKIFLLNIPNRENQKITPTPYANKLLKLTALPMYMTHRTIKIQKNDFLKITVGVNKNSTHPGMKTQKKLQASKQVKQMCCNFANPSRPDLLVQFNQIKWHVRN